MQQDTPTFSPKRWGWFGLSPLIVFLSVYLLTSICAGDFYKMPITVAFTVASIYAVAITRGIKLEERIRQYSRGASDPNILLMIWIFVLAGAFATGAKSMGAIDATVNLILSLLPSSLLLPGLFIAACFISLSIGTSVGTVIALVPIALGLGESLGLSNAYVAAVVTGGAFFGDNLSFISDTTVVATQTQGCNMKDKFRVNAMIVAPAAMIVLAVYAVLGAHTPAPHATPPIDYLKIAPYLLVLITAIAGLNVMAVLTIGLVLCGIIGLCAGDYTLYGWFAIIGDGVLSMGELIIIAMMAGGMLEIIRENGGIDFIINKLTLHINGKRGAELSIAALVSLVNLCTANNTVAILTVGGIARKIAEQYGVDPRKSASILDTFSCAVQGLIPYGVQMLLAAGLAHISPMQILPYLFYPFGIGICALLAIVLRLPRRFS